MKHRNNSQVKKEEIISLEEELWLALDDDIGLNGRERFAKQLAQKLETDSPEIIISILKQAILIGPRDR